MLRSLVSGGPSVTAMRMAALVLLTLPLAAQPPAINQEGVRNAASMLPSSLPGAGIARGARFVILGLRFAGDSRVLVSGQAARVLESNYNRIEALMPDSAALGDNLVVVTNADGESRPFRIRVARSSPGLYQEPASASPGEEAATTGTGIDPRSPPELRVGAMSATIRKVEPAEAGKYRIRFVTPRDAPTGCQVPVYVRDHEGHVSNFITISVHIPNRPCDDGPAWPFAKMSVGGTGGLAGAVRVRYSLSTGGTPFRSVADIGFAAFLAGDSEQGPFNLRGFRPPPGSCQVVSDLSQPGALPTLPALLLALGRPRGLSAGAAIQMRGASVAAVLPAVPDEPGVYSATIGGSPLVAGQPGIRPLFLGADETLVSAPGGAQIGPFQLRLPGLPRLEWPGHESIQLVDRERGFTARWQSDSRVLLVLVNVDQQTTAMTAAACQPRAGARSFQVAPATLANFPASTPDRPLPVGWVGLLTLPDGRGAPFHATGIDVGYGMTMQVILRGVRYR